jgi:hypothetical protein
MKYTLETHPKPKFSIKSKEVFINGDEQILCLEKYCAAINDILLHKSYEYRYIKYNLEVEQMQIKNRINQINK